MRVLIFGGDGMLGHQLCSVLSERNEVGVTTRRGPEGATRHQAIPDVDVRDLDRVKDAIATFEPEAVVNAVGIVKQRAEARDPLPSLEVNAVFPHRLADLCRRAQARLVHISTDCVFSGSKGDYRETDPPDPLDVYGRTKLLGELDSPHLTLRTSMIGLELGRRQGLVEWFLASRGVVKGYRRAVFSGLTTRELARVVERVLTRHTGLSGLFHVGARPIDKHTLLVTLAEKLGRDEPQIEPADEPEIDRSLNAEAFAAATGYEAPTWEAMLAELAAEIQHRRR